MVRAAARVSEPADNNGPVDGIDAGLDADADHGEVFSGDG